jgi:hypothetical protein
MIINETGDTNVNLNSDENVGTGQSVSFAELDSQSGNPRLSEAEEKVQEKVSESDTNPKIPEEKAQKSPENPKNGKKVTYSAGDQTLELDTEARFKHKVDGQEVEWTLQELLNDKSGKTAWDKKFQELSVERNSFKKERDVIENYIRGFQEVAMKGDSLGAMEYLAQMAGISPLEFKKNLRTQVQPEFEKWLQMNEEQRRVKELEDEVNYTRQQRESEAAKVKAQQSQQELDSKLKVAQEAHGFSDSDLVEAYDVLAGYYKPEQVTLDLITDYMRERNAVTKAEKLLEQVDTELIQNEKVLDSIADMIVKGRHTDDELLDLISATYAKKSTRKRTEVKPAAAPEKKIEVNKNIKVPLRWDDLE